MKRIFRNSVSVTVLFGAMVLGAPVMAETVAQTHMGHVSTAWGDTPDGVGLLPAALAEAEIAAYHAGVAVTKTDDLDWMKEHAGHVLQAVNGEGNGPGLGYGVLQAAEGVAYHIGIAAEDASATDNIKLHAEHVAVSANNVVAWVAAIEDHVAKVQAASSAAEAAPFAMELQMLASALAGGVDANGDGDITWVKGEGGLNVAAAHMGIMFEGEGM